MAWSVVWINRVPQPNNGARRAHIAGCHGPCAMWLAPGTSPNFVIAKGTRRV
jgi:hypothetical protein